MLKYQILQHLLPYGPDPEHFGWKFPHEGFVVEFYPTKGPPWVGNFAGGLGGINEVVEHPDGIHLIVVALGRLYVINPETRIASSDINDLVHSVFDVPELKEIVFGDPWKFIAIGPKGILWKTRELSIDGMHSLRRDGMILKGQAEDLGNGLLPFEINLINGAVTGGYSGSFFHRDLN